MTDLYYDALMICARRLYVARLEAGTWIDEKDLKRIDEEAMTIVEECIEQAKGNCPERS